MMNNTLFYETSQSLTHHGILGQKWGVRRFQNKDGTLTPKGRAKYRKDAQRLDKNIKREKGNIDFLGKQWREEGYKKKDIDLGLEEYRVNLKRMQDKLQNINAKLKQEPVTNVKIDKVQQKIESSRQEGLVYASRKREAIQKDIDSFIPFLETGIKDKNGRLMLSPEDVSKSVEALRKLKDKI